MGWKPRPASAKRHDIRGSNTPDDRFDTDAPLVEGSTLLGIVAVSVINRCDASLGVIQNLRHHKPRHAGTDHQAGSCPPQVMTTEVHSCACSNSLDGLLNVPYRLGLLASGTPEDPFGRIIRFAQVEQYPLGGRRKWHSVGSSVLGAMRRYRPPPVKADPHLSTACSGLPRSVERSAA